MKSLHVLAVVVLGFEMPVPIYWFVLHGRVDFWRRHIRAGYWVAILSAWGLGDGLLYHFRAPLFHGATLLSGSDLFWLQCAGLALMAVDIVVFAVAESELGGRRLVGHSELTGRGQLTTRGLYTWVRHPRYFGMITGVLGGCLFVATVPICLLGMLWFLLALGFIALEERELRERFGAAYADYASRVPALLPFRLRSRPGA